jgi:hypothetical protein
MMWPAYYAQEMRRLHREHPEPLSFLWGGNNLQTRFSHFGVRPGDTIYPVMISKKRLYLLGRMTVAALADLREYLRAHPRARERMPAYSMCANEALVGTHGSLLHFDLTVPREMLERWRFTGNRGERSIKGLVDGDITLAIPFHGIYKLSPGTARDVFNLLLDHEAAAQLRARRGGGSPAECDG